MQIQVPASEWEGASLARLTARQHVVIDVNAGTVTQFLSTDVVAQLQDALVHEMGNTGISSCTAPPAGENPSSGIVVAHCIKLINFFTASTVRNH